VEIERGTVIDISAVVLNKLLTEGSLELWAKLKLSFLDSAYSSVYSAINRHYTKYNSIPTFEDLEVSLREGATSNIVAALKLVDTEDISSDVALDALIDNYTQSETIKLLDRFVDKLPLYDTVEIKDNLANIVLTLDEKTLTTEGVFAMNDILLFQPDDELHRNKVFLGLNNTFDAVLGGVARQELILIGGKRGSGKSIASNNLMVNQYEAGNSSLYFSIEMTGYETLQRTMSILAGVNHQSLKQNKLTEEEILRVVKARAGMFKDSNGLVDEFLKTNDRYKFESTLIRECKLKDDNQMIIIDDRALTLSSVDLHIGKAKAKFGDKLTTVIIDYLNQIVIEGGFSQFDWQPQVIISKKLKEIARKYDIVMVSPYQIDATGEARFAKGILDAADIALTMEAHDKDLAALTFDTSKIRGGREMKFTSPIDWDTLRISPVSIETPEKKEAVKKSGKKEAKKTDEEAVDLPWDQ
jgi:replicative DNA helicase